MYCAIDRHDKDVQNQHSFEVSKSTYAVLDGKLCACSKILAVLFVFLVKCLQFLFLLSFQQILLCV